MEKEARQNRASIWIGCAVLFLVSLGVVFWVFGSQSPEPKRYIAENFTAPGQQLQIYRDFYCFPADTGAERTKALSIGFGRKVIHAEVFLSGFNLSTSGGPLNNVGRVRADANIMSIHGNYVTLELIYALANDGAAQTEACIGYTILAITTTE